MTRLAIIALGLVLLVVAGVYWSGASSREPHADFTFINRGENKDLDPNTMAWMQDIRLAYSLWEGLCTLDQQGKARTFFPTTSGRILAKDCE